MKLVLLEPGFEAMTGQYGAVEFVDGKSVEDVPPRTAIRISAALKAVWEDGTTPDMGALFGIGMGQSAHRELAAIPVQPTREYRGGEVFLLESAAAAAGEVSGEDEPPAAGAPVGTSHTDESLGKVADEGGIAGLRAIAEPFGVKDNSIPGLIRKILKAQAEVTARAQPAEQA